jgi:hypothetical protein
MNVVKSLVLVPMVVAGMSVAAFAQETESNVPKHYFTGLGGATINLDFDHPAFMFAAEYGERLHRDVQAYANFSYMDNLMSQRMRDNLVLAGDDLTASTGVPWEFRGHDRGMAFVIGGKFLLPADLAFRPYVGGGFGILNLRRHITERDLGDVSEGFYELTVLNDGVMDAGAISANKPLTEILIGAGGAFGRTYIDVAYRYRKAFHSFEPIAFSQVTFGIGYAWF